MWFIFLPRLRFPLSLTLPYPIRNSLPFTSLRSVTVGSGRDFLEGDIRRGQAHRLLARWLDPEPAVAVVVAHDDDTTVELQLVRVLAEPWVSTWRPIAAGAGKVGHVANVGQMIILVLTQGGQVEVIVCVSCRGKGLRYRPGFSFVICSPICSVYCGVRVKSAYIRLLLKPHAAFI